MYCRENVRLIDVGEDKGNYASLVLRSYEDWFGSKKGLELALLRLFGLFGPHGPMPMHVTELARERLRAHQDPTLARFSDIFHHRLLALFYRSWAQNQPTVQHDRPKNDRFAAWSK